MRAREVWLAVLLGGCSSILGFHAPEEARDSGPVDTGSAADGSVDSSLPDFTLAVASTSPRVASGGVEALAIRVTDLRGFSGDVSLAIPTPPSGVTATPVTIPAGQTTGSLTLTGSGSLTVGSTVSLDVVGTSGSLVRQLTVQATVSLRSGTVDTTFGGAATGFATVPLTVAELTDVRVDSADRITVFGVTEQGSAVSSLLAQYTGSGALDPGFGSGGLLLYGSAVAPSQAASMVRHDDFVTTIGAGSDATEHKSQTWLAGFTNTGAVRNGFGAGGNAFVEQGPSLGGVTAAIDQAHEYLIVGQSAADFVLARLNAAGGLDGGFAGGTGLALGFQVGFHAIAPDLTGAAHAIYVLGTKEQTHLPALVRVTSAGAFDPTFGSGGRVNATATGDSIAVALQSTGAPIVLENLATGFISLARYRADGSLDPGFGSGGVVTTVPALVAGRFVNGVDLAIQSDDKIVVAVAVNNLATLFRYNADGSLDMTYGTGGFASLGGPTNFQLEALDLLSNGDAIAVGIVDSSPTQGVLTRAAF